ncbi:tRNA (adenosine(37)-N6)-threonylcarbamoyltransferase complex ATPase subunit type 1 TsaE [Paludifilum halophilum]|uniref:tRNA threonylcarbamoyladenosine biosynthesis protein TsaE n=1 Tax=Paludifilum halophilum TaxID=1642702 RepID=A0A235B3M5_9BACL|nr:tRNA (adenosine(37)-N6)-threonylcarbamoyltransferase complex ATPase subunit type 1 TsaE [Paludifilum halophilum]OYD06841.1 tRNA (adenosine(37)-N6)-threonylcarbamoyltransferase complex ATPase subunit type 1 TsaE [Paludifilum halophilum]
MNQKRCDIVSSSSEETRKLGRHLAERLRPGDVIALEGDLGAGKTTLSQGVAEGLGIQGPIDSPTFTLIKEYDEGRLPFYHMDVYRLDSWDEELGWDDYFYGDGVTLVEWADRIRPRLPERIVRIQMNHGPGDSRYIQIIPPDGGEDRICKGLSEG